MNFVRNLTFIMTGALCGWVAPYDWTAALLAAGAIYTVLEGWK